jgi:hypothetical protein
LSTAGVAGLSSPLMEERHARNPTKVLWNGEARSGRKNRE